MCTWAKRYTDAGEPFAAALFSHPCASRFTQLAYAYKADLEAQPLTEYNGARLYPCGTKPTPPYAVRMQFCDTFVCDTSALAEKDPALLSPLADAYSMSDCRNTVHTVAGFGYCHSLPHYGRILKEGFDMYRTRILQRNGELKEGLLALLDGIRTYRDRCIAYLREQHADPTLIAALEHVPFSPARNIYEAIVCYNFIYYLDGCDNVGCIAADLLPFWNGEDITELLSAFFDNVDVTNGYSASVGPDNNGLVLQCLRAIKGRRRPQIELRVTKDTSNEIWDAAADALAAGGANPALYNEEGYRNGFHAMFSDMPNADFARFCGVGCTESSLAGLTCAGSLDAGIHLLDLFSRCMRQSLSECTSFEDFYNIFMEQYRAELADTVQRLDTLYALRAAHRPQPMRTLLVDDCIDNDTEFYAGGARYNWSVVSFAGIVNVIESMLAVKELIYEKKRLTPDTLITGLDTEDPTVLTLCKSITHYGTGDTDADRFAAALLNDILDETEHRLIAGRCRILPASIQFQSFVGAGKCVPATPDGRKNGASLADSLSAIHGYDDKGVTAMLGSAARLPLGRMIGTPVLNLRLSKRFLLEHLRALVSGFFASGGMQLQITCQAKEDLLCAREAPQDHGNLIVRVGGYAEYFVRLSHELQDQVISRTEFS